MTDTEYTLLLLSYYLFLVVICFHFTIFVVLETTSIKEDADLKEL